MLKKILIFIFINLTWATDRSSLNIPYLKVEPPKYHIINKSFRIAVGDIAGNLGYYKNGLLKEKKICLMAGLDYDKPWTRDAAINTWNCMAILGPDVAKNTLKAQVINKNGKKIIGGQYWDNVIWAIGAWEYYLITGNKDFLRFSYQVIRNTIRIRERYEFNPKINLFRGPAVYGDGVAAYPKIYTRSVNKNIKYSGINSWAENNPDLRNSKGRGIPMYTLSTNCVYYKAYEILAEMAKILSYENEGYTQKSIELKKSINKQFWDKNLNRYKYIVDPFGGSNRQESLGNIFAIKFGIASGKKIKKIIDSMYIEKAGIPCVYPTFKRYKKCPGDHYGRHSGTVWPHIQGFWAEVCCTNDYNVKFIHEFDNLTNFSFRDKQFVEIYHPNTGLPYGGLQEPDLEECDIWDATNRQTWSATAYLRIILKSIFGLHFTQSGLELNPYLPDGIETMEIRNIHYRNMILNIKIKGYGSEIKKMKIDNKILNNNFIENNLTGSHQITIILGDTE